MARFRPYASHLPPVDYEFFYGYVDNTLKGIGSYTLKGIETNTVKGGYFKRYTV